MKRYNSIPGTVIPGYLLFALLSLSLFPGCSEAPIHQSLPATHKQASWNSYEIIGFDLVLWSTGNPRLEASFWLDPALSRSRMETPDGSVIVFDGSEFYASGPELNRARFHVLTWPYFLAAPYKLNDPGTVREDLGPTTMDGKDYPTMRLSFRPGVGDTPDDWYIVYQDPDTKRLHGMAYIVTYAKDTARAEKDPHAIRYNDYETFEGIPIATRWTFHPWNRPDSSDEASDDQKSADKEVISRDTLMEARLTNFSFYVDRNSAGRNEPSLPAPPEKIFEAPDGARKLAKP